MKHARPTRRPSLGWTTAAALVAALVLTVATADLRSTLFGSSDTTDQARPPSPSSELRESVDSFMEATRTPGVRLTAVGPDRAVHRVVRNARPEGPFQLFSASKPFVAALAFLLAERGTIDVDEAIGPIDGLADPDAFAEYSLLDLLEHRVLMTDYRTVLADDEVVSEIELVDRVIADSRPSRADEPFYASTGYLVAGLVISQKAGLPWDRLLTEEILSPLELQDTSVASAARSRSRHAAGGIFSTTDDLARFASALFRDGAVLSPESLERMRPGPGRPFGAGAWAMCPCSLDGSEQLAIGHPGETSVVYWMPTTGTVVAIDLDASIWEPSNRMGEIDGLVARIDSFLSPW